MANRLALVNLPGSGILSYDAPRATVIFAEFISGEFIDTSHTHTKPSLGPTVRRAGWNGVVWSGRLFSRSNTPGGQRSHHPIYRVPPIGLGTYHFTESLQNDPALHDKLA